MCLCVDANCYRTTYRMPIMRDKIQSTLQLSLHKKVPHWEPLLIALKTRTRRMICIETEDVSTHLASLKLGRRCPGKSHKIIVMSPVITCVIGTLFSLMQTLMQMSIRFTSLSLAPNYHSPVIIYYAVKPSEPNGTHTSHQSHWLTVRLISLQGSFVHGWKDAISLLEQLPRK